MHLPNHQQIVVKVHSSKNFFLIFSSSKKNHSQSPVPKEQNLQLDINLSGKKLLSFYWIFSPLFCLLSSIFISFSASLCFLLCLIFCQRKSSQIGCYLFYYFYFMWNFIFLYRLAHLLVCHTKISSFFDEKKR